ncbi:MAG: hypothetical protein ABIZ81_10070 [Opitutaceae bacterium]
MDLLIGTPRQQVTEYLQVVAALTRFLSSEHMRKGILTVGSEDELRGLLRRTINVGL